MNCISTLTVSGVLHFIGARFPAFPTDNMAANTERTFIMIKPDGVHRGVVGEIIKRFEQKGYKLVALKYIWVRSEILLSLVCYV